MATNTMNAAYVDRIYELWRLIYLRVSTIANSLPNITTPLTRTITSSNLTGIGTTASGVYSVARFYNPESNAGSVLINNVSLEPGASRTYSVEKPDRLGSVSYDTAGQTIYVEFMN